MSQAHRRARIVATIGPATTSEEKLRELILAGADVMRLNFSHGSHEDHAARLQAIRRIARELDKPIALLQDLQGPRIRTGKLAFGTEVELQPGQLFKITSEPILGDANRISTSYKDLPHDVKKGDRILLADGSIELDVLETNQTEVMCKVIDGGTLGQNKGMNLPGVAVSLPALTDKDRLDLEFGLRQGVDYVAISFVRKPEDVVAVLDTIAAHEQDVPVIAKLEKPESITNLDQILEVAYGVMVARGDLGVELAPERVPVIQKHIIQKANESNRLVITATQMLESMMSNQRPTRAEASDVANAVFDGTDALMLSGETATGEYPIEAVQMMARIIEEAEHFAKELSRPFQFAAGEKIAFPAAVCDAAFHAARAVGARAIVVFTQTGATARLISKYRPASEIIAFTPHELVTRRMNFYWGVKPMIMHAISNVDELIQALDRVLLERNLTKEGDKLVILTGAPIVERGHTSLLKLHSVTKRQ